MNTLLCGVRSKRTDGVTEVGCWLIWVTYMSGAPTISRVMGRNSKDMTD